MTLHDRGGPVSALRALLVALATGSFFGYTISATNSAMGPVGRQFSLTGLTSGIFVGALLVGALLGCAAAARWAGRYAHRSVLVRAAVVAASGCAVMAAAPVFPVLVGGRLVTGLALGVTTSLAPVVIAETAPARRRGSMVTMYQLSLACAAVTALAVGTLLGPDGHWRAMLACNAVPALLQAAVVAVAVPRTAEGARTRSAPAARSAAYGLVGTLRDPALRRPVVVACGAALMNACVGVGAVTYYSTFVFGVAGLDGPGQAQRAALVVGTVNALSTVVGLWLIGRYGRRPLLSAGLAGMAVSLAVAAWGLWASASGATGLVTVAAVLVFVACYAFSAGPIAWLLVSEVLPLRIRDRTAATATAMNWTANLVIALLFPLVVGDPGSPGRASAAFGVFAVITAGFLVFTRLCVPETGNRAPASLEAGLTGGPALRTLQPAAGSLRPPQE
ncbi:MFS transporter [Streptomyces lavendulae]|uniref:MFS transporter n=1 Tax=Streptomyces lavendulae TaxID=1914 RepID=UPI00367A2184